MRLALYTAGFALLLVLIGICWVFGQFVTALREVFEGQAQGKLEPIETRARAAQVALQLFREFKALGIDLNTSQAAPILKAVRGLSSADQRALWQRVGALTRAAESESPTSHNQGSVK